jgi:AcrR family transcriptional regulator
MTRVSGDATTRPARARDAAATRQDLLRAAQRRFVLLGYERTTTRDVAADAGVNLSLINRYFGGKEGLFEAVVAGFPDALSETETATGSLVDDFLAGLQDGAWSEFGAHPLLLLLRDSSADARIQALRTMTLTMLVERISADAETRGPVDAGDTELRAQLVVALLSGAILLRSVTLLEPLRSATVEQLRGPLADAVAALVGPQHPKPRA